MTVSGFMTIWALSIVNGIQSDVFSSRDFIWALMTEHEREYIQLLNEDRSDHPIWNVHKQIGKYLADHAGKSLPIASFDVRERSLSPLGNESATMMWRKL